jgi:hypothetical protein
MSRDWSRMYCADIVAGAYTREELASAGYSDAVEVTRPSDLSPRLRERLRGPIGDAHDMTADFDAAIKSARVEETKKSAKAADAASAAADAGSTDSDASVETASSLQPGPSASDGAVNHPSEEKAQ